ncbi:MAG TPA: DUF692 domain-containing protein [Polyangiaceae bacterium]|nr:DUF692 domain-containing protein [Polyangiaceae bacterium]
MHRAADPQQALNEDQPGRSRTELGRVGFGLRAQHYESILSHGLRADFAEAITENFLGRGGRAFSVLERVRLDMPVALHGVSLSIGGMDPVTETYLRELSELATRIAACSVSDHLCFGTFGGHYAHDLWPLPYTEEALCHVVERVQRVQDRLGRRLLLENVSSYVEYRASTLTEWEFLSEVVTRADAGILLDLNNVFVSAKNHGFSPVEYLAGLPRTRVQQIHLAGHSDAGAYLFDDHGSPVSAAVWQLYEHSLELFDAQPTIVEWDERLPELSVLEAEADHARALSNQRLAARQEAEP